MVAQRIGREMSRMDPTDLEYDLKRWRTMIATSNWDLDKSPHQSRSVRKTLENWGGAIATLVRGGAR